MSKDKQILARPILGLVADVLLIESLWGHRPPHPGRRQRLVPS